MTGHRGAQGLGRGVSVADLTDQNDVGVLTHKRTDAARKIKLGTGGEVALTHHWQGILHRVLECHDVDALFVQPGENRVQGGRFAAAGGSRHQDHSFGSGNHHLNGVDLGIEQIHLF